MTKRERAALGRYVRSVADLMGLRDWTFKILSEPCSDENCAECTPTYGRRIAEIALCRGFRSHDRVEQRNTVVHELLHCVFAAEEAHLWLHLPKLVPDSACGVFQDAYLMHEYAVDSLAEALSAHMPMVEWPT